MFLARPYLVVYSLLSCTFVAPSFDKYARTFPQIIPVHIKIEFTVFLQGIDDPGNLEQLTYIGSFSVAWRARGYFDEIKSVMHFDSDVKLVLR